MFTSDWIGFENSLVVGDRPSGSRHDSVNHGSLNKRTPFVGKVLLGCLINKRK